MLSTATKVVTLVFIFTANTFAFEQQPTRSQHDSLGFKIDTTVLNRTESDKTQASNMTHPDTLMEYLLDPTIIAALIQVFFLALITIFAGTWLHRKQSVWNYQQSSNHIRLQWRYDFQKDLNDYARRIAKLLSAYGSCLSNIERWQQTPHKEQFIHFSILKSELNLKLINAGNELIGLRNSSKVLFQESVFMELSDINQNLWAIVTDNSLTQLKQSEVGHFGEKFAHLSDMITTELQEDLLC